MDGVPAEVGAAVFLFNGVPFEAAEVDGLAGEPWLVEGPAPRGDAVEGPAPRGDAVLPRGDAALPRGDAVLRAVFCLRAGVAGAELRIRLILESEKLGETTWFS